MCDGLKSFNQRERGSDLETKLLKIRHVSRPNSSNLLPTNLRFEKRRFQNVCGLVTSWLSLDCFVSVLQPWTISWRTSRRIPPTAGECRFRRLLELKKVITSMSIAFFNFSMRCGVCPVCRKTLRGRGLLMRVLEVTEDRIWRVFSRLLIFFDFNAEFVVSETSERVVR